MTRDKIVSVAPSGGCDSCGGSEDVVKYRDSETGETYCVCDPCEQAAAGV